MQVKLFNRTTMWLVTGSRDQLHQPLGADAHPRPFGHTMHIFVYQKLQNSENSEFQDSQFVSPEYWK